MSEKIPKIFYLLIGLALSFYLTNNVIEPILPIYITNLGASTLELGLIMSLASISSIIVRVPFGIIAEKIGRWRVILYALLLQSISFILYSLAKNTTWFYPIRIIHALSSTSFHPVALALAFELAPRGKSGDTMGRYLSTIGISMAMGPLISGLIIKYWEYNTLFF